MERRTKPDGGFRFIRAYDILGVYFAYTADLIGWYDVRVWFACHEAVARRCGARKGIPAKYREEEIRQLVDGAGVQWIRAALKRLQSAGLLWWSEKSITFGKSPDEIQMDNKSGFWMMVEDFGQANRNVPVPRRAIRRIAAGSRKVETATMLGHVLRCCYFRRGEYSSEGSCSASWIGRVFGLDKRNVKIARKRLIRDSWLLGAKADAWHRQRFGGRTIVNAEWGGFQRPCHYVVARNESRHKEQQRSPRIGSFDAKRSPLLILKENSFGTKNQKPAVAADRPAGFSIKDLEGKGQPSLRRIAIQDLRDSSRLLALFEEAVRREFVKKCEADRLKFFAGAERAVRVGERNPCGLFATLVRHKLWHHITLDDEDTARRRLKQMEEEGTF